MTLAQRLGGVSVVNLDRENFNRACARLMALVQNDWRPDFIIGIKTGGYHVAQAMACASTNSTPVLAITCRRPSSKFKPISNAIRRMVSALPRALLDKLRVVEHLILTRKTATKPYAYQFDQAELDALDVAFAHAREGCSILIVDDSVDTGATLAAVTEKIRHKAPPDATLRSAVITMTTPQPVITPDYILLEQKLCRFPWSLDAQPEPAR